MVTIAEIDYESYSEAGYHIVDGKWKPIQKNKTGIGIVGSAVYSEHPSTRIICMSYNLKEGLGDRLWIPVLPNPKDLFEYIQSGGLVEAHNSLFEYFMWINVCCKKMGWPPLPLNQIRCSRAKAKVFTLPGKLEKAVEVLKLAEQKDTKGKNLIKKLSIPTNTKKPPSKKDYDDFHKYCVQDIVAERSLSNACPPMSDFEMQVFKMHQEINVRGVQIDTELLDNCICVYEQAFNKYSKEFKDIIGDDANSISEVSNIVAWLNKKGLRISSLDEETIQSELKKVSGTDVGRVLELRLMLASASVKKLYSIKNMLCSDNRIRDIFQYYGAERTGRFTGHGPQPHNLPGSGPDHKQCLCGRTFGASVNWCPWCNSFVDSDTPVKEWSSEAIDQAILDISSRDLGYVERCWGNAVSVISGCLRGLFCAAPGYEFICSDFSAIEAVVLAVIADETWRINVFKTHRKIYETCASRITGIPLEEFLKHKETTGSHHPLRKKFGKIPELASGYQGWIGAWKQFGADKYMTEEEMKDNILKWRSDSPNIAGVKRYGEVIHWGMWQGLEHAVRMAITSPGQWFKFRGIYYVVKRDILCCRLPSGRYLYYHHPQISGFTDQISFMGWNSNPKFGKTGWVRIDTYGGKLTENVVQAIARDILVNGMLNINPQYPIVLHVHDETVSEVPIGWGSIEDYEKKLANLPWWCKDWPIIADGGWRGPRFKKD